MERKLPEDFLMDHLIDNLNDAFAGFRLEAKCIGAQRHRHFAFFDVKLGARAQVAQIQRKSNEIALKIRSHSIPIIKPIPQEGIVRLQVVLGTPESIALSDLYKTASRPAGLLPFLLGERDDGEHLWADMSQNPHMIVAGAPGSGKSVLLHNMIHNAARCDNTIMFLIDPKGNEFAHYQDQTMNGAVAGMATDYDGSLFILDYLIEEMENRYKALAARKMQSIEQDPLLFKKIVLIIDEAADLMANDFSGQFQEKLVRLAQKSRAAGIFLVLGTQRPSVDVITGLIKANFEARIALRVSSKTDSQIILGMPGAERLLGKGDAIISTKSHNFVRFQVGHVDPTSTVKYCTTNR